jgi:cation transport regulator ChaB
MTETTHEDRLATAHAAMEQARKTQDADAFHAAFDEWKTAEDERDEARREAVGRGIDTSRGVGDFDTLSRVALTQHVTRLIEVLEDRTRGDGMPDLSTEEGRLEFAEDYAGYLADGPLFAKLIAAYFIESDVTDGLPIPNGVVGRAIDRAIEELLPYATAGGGGWYNHDVAPQL